MSEPKIYLNKFTSVKSSKFGFRIYIKDIDALAEELKANANADGSVKVEVTTKLKADKFGNDGTVVLDTWMPTPKTESLVEVSADAPF